MNQQQLQSLHKALIEERERLTRQEKENDHFGLDEAMNSSIGELSGYDNHPADIGTELFEREKDQALQQATERQLAEIDSALARMEQGVYGRCQVCGQEIDFERLEALPWTRSCAEHTPEQHPTRDRPVEVEMLKQNHHDQDAWQLVEQYGTSNPADFFREGTDAESLQVAKDEQRLAADQAKQTWLENMDHED